MTAKVLVLVKAVENSNDGCDARGGGVITRLPEIKWGARVSGMQEASGTVGVYHPVLRKDRCDGDDDACSMFGATERMRFPGPGGTIAHAEIQIGDSVVIVEDEYPYRGTTAPPAGGLPGSPASLFIYVADVDAVIAHAVELGATLQRPADGRPVRLGRLLSPLGATEWVAADGAQAAEIKRQA